MTGKRSEPSYVKREAQSIKAFFAKQQKRKVCSICGEHVLAGVYRSHVDSCRLRDSDSDVEVVEVLSPVEAKARKAGPPIVLDDDSPKEEQKEEESVKEDKKVSTKLLTEATETAKTHTVVSLRRSRRIMDIPKQKPDEHDALQDQGVRAGIKRSIEAKLEDHKEMGCSQDALTKKEQDEEPEITPADELENKVCSICGEHVLAGVYRSHVDSCRVRDSDNDVEVVEVLSPVEAKARKAGPPIVLDDDSPKEEEPVKVDKKVSWKLSTEAAETAKTLAVVSLRRSRRIMDIPKQKPDDALQDQGLRAGIKRSIEAKLEDHKEMGCSQDALTKKEQDEEPEITPADELENNDELQQQQGSPPYFKYVDKMIAQVISGGYDQDFWGPKWNALESLSKCSSPAKDLLLRIFLRQRQWLTKASLEERYRSGDGIYEELLAVGLLEDGKESMTLAELLKICPLEELKRIGKKYRIDVNKAKSSIIEELAKFVRNHKDLFGRAKGVEANMRKLIFKQLGCCLKITEAADDLLQAVMTIHTPSETNSSLIYELQRSIVYQNFLLHVHKIESGVYRVAAPSNPPIIHIYRKVNDLEQYLEAKKLEIQLFELWRKGNIAEAEKLGAEAHDRLSRVDWEYCSNLSPSLRRFTAASPLLRCLALWAGTNEKRKDYSKAVEIFRTLLFTHEYKGFCSDSRGEWWLRLALNLEFHLKLPADAEEMLLRGMEDEFVADKDLLNLEIRYGKLCKNPKYGRVNGVVPEPKIRYIEGTILTKELGDGRVNRFVETNDEGELQQVSVELLTLSYYKTQLGFSHGIHCEGSAWHMILGVLLYGQIYDNSISNAWVSPYQMEPLDLNYPEFFTARQEAIAERLQYLRNATSADLLEKVCRFWKENASLISTKINYSIFSSAEDMHEYIECVGVLGLAEVFGYLLKDHRNTRSGFPDLVLWNSADHKFMAVEVKGPGDRLSSKQTLWLDRLTRAGISAEVCHVKAKAQRAL